MRELNKVLSKTLFCVHTLILMLLHQRAFLFKGGLPSVARVNSFICLLIHLICIQVQTASNPGWILQNVERLRILLNSIFGIKMSHSIGTPWDTVETWPYFSLASLLRQTITDLIPKDKSTTSLIKHCAPDIQFLVSTSTTHWSRGIYLPQPYTFPFPFQMSLLKDY